MSNRNFISPLLLALMIGASLGVGHVAAAQPGVSPQANVDTSYARVIIRPRIMLSQGEQDRLQAYADRGMSALRQYLWRTRMIYNYYLPDILNTP